MSKINFFANSFSFLTSHEVQIVLHMQKKRTVQSRKISINWITCSVELDKKKKIRNNIAKNREEKKTKCLSLNQIFYECDKFTRLYMQCR